MRSKYLYMGITYALLCGGAAALPATHSFWEGVWKLWGMAALMIGSYRIGRNL
jgi:hypothetical protein